MGKLRNFLFESVDNSYDTDSVEGTNFTEDVEVSPEEVNTEGIKNESFIKDIYDKNDLSDFSRSVFKVEELLASLPKEMPTETKKKTIGSILSSFGLTPEEIVSDAEKRTETIKAALSSVSDENEKVISDNEIMIEQKKNEIAALEMDNAERKEFISDAEEKAKEETERIQALKEFVYQEEK